MATAVVHNASFRKGLNVALVNLRLVNSSGK